MSATADYSRGVTGKDTAFAKDLELWTNGVARGEAQTETRKQVAEVMLQAFEEKDSCLCFHWREGLDTLPPLIGRMTFLTDINLDNCMLGSLPKEIGLLHNLKTLNLKYTHLKELPKELWQLTNLRVLLLNGVALEKLPEDIGGLRLLRRLALSCTQIRELPKSLSTLPKLRSIEAQSSMISKEQVEKILQQCAIERTKLGESQFEELVQLRESLLKGCDVTVPGKEREELERRIKFLESLSGWATDPTQSETQQLVRRKVSWKIYQVFNKKKRSLRLCNIDINSLPSCIGMIVSLKELAVCNTQLKALPEEIGNLSQLYRLVILESQLQTLPPEVGNLTNLRSLHLDKNQLESIPDEVTKLTKLDFLSLSNNKLNSIPQELWSLDRLEQLHLDHNNIVSIPEAPEGKNERLRRLVLNNNPLRTLPPSLDSFAGLREFDIEGTGVDILFWWFIMEKNFTTPFERMFAKTAVAAKVKIKNRE